VTSLLVLLLFFSDRTLFHLLVKLLRNELLNLLEPRIPPVNELFILRGVVFPSLGPLSPVLFFSLFSPKEKEKGFFFPSTEGVDEGSDTAAFRSFYGTWSRPPKTAGLRESCFPRMNFDPSITRVGCFSPPSSWFFFFFFCPPFS